MTLINRFLCACAVLLLASFSAGSAFAASIANVTSGPQDGIHNLNLLTSPALPPCCDPDANNFALHDHGYFSPNIPNTERAFVLFEFSEPVIVDSLILVQHRNGITFLQHSAGNGLPTLQPGSLAISQLFGDVTGSSVLSEYAHDSFSFSDQVVAKFHQFVVAKTSDPAGWASYRWYLQFHTPAVPEPSSLALLALGLVVVARLATRRRSEHR